VENQEIKTAMQAAILSEVKKWTEESVYITDGYEFEDQLLRRVQSIGKIMMQSSVGSIPENRNKKNFTPVWAK